MRPNPCWELFKDINFASRTKIVYYLQEFYSGKQIILSKYLGRKLWKLEHKRNKIFNKLGDCNSEINKIIEKVLKRRK